MDAVFKALADATRRRLLDRLRQRGGQSLVELATPLDMTRQAVAKHLRILEDAGLVVTQKVAREKRHELNPVPIQEMHDRWIRHFERDRLAALGELKRGLEGERSGGAGMTDRFVYVMYIDTSPTQLWQALTRPEFTQRYWGGRRIQSDWRPGSPVRHIRPDGSLDWSGEVIEAREPEFLCYTFNEAGSDGQTDPRPTRVSFRLDPYGATVRLTVVHEGFEPGAKGYRTAAEGWVAILSSLKSLLERGEPLSYPWKG